MKPLSTLFLLFLFLQINAQTDCVTVTSHILSTSCEGANDGIVDISVIGGIPPYSFLWSNGATTEDINGLAPGEYTVTITDSIGCVTQYPANNDLEAPLLIPDSGGTPLAAPININQFAEGATVEDGDKFEICVVMEHSWLRDLEISLVCPDGTTVILHDHPANTGGEVYMGEPVDGDNDNPTPGVGYEYCWKSTSLTGTILQNIKGGIQTLPSATYSAYESFDNFIGCSLNGTWYLTIEDSWANDNGFVFDWYMNINDGDLTSFTVTESEADCEECQQEYHCMQWLRDTISNHTDIYEFAEIANWDGRTVFMISRGDASDGGFTDFFDCEGNLFQTFIAGWSQTYIPNPPLVTFEELTDVETIWSSEVPLEDCGAALALAEYSVSDVSCFGGNNGGACATANGGLPPYTFLWEDENGFSLEGDCIENIPAGDYTLTIKDANNNETEAIPVTIAQPDEIIINIELAPGDDGQSCIPFVNINGGVAPYSISWAPEVVVDEVIVNVVDANGCIAESTADCTINGTYNITGLEYFSIAPNPTDGIFQLSAGFTMEKTVRISIKNITGQEVMSKIISASQFNEQFNLSDQPGGMYFVEMVSEGNSMVERLILGR